MAQVRQRVTAIGWVREELENSLARVRRYIESNLDDSSEILPLQRAMVDLHQVRGTLQMVECRGAALLVEEMRNVVHDMLKNRNEVDEAAIESLLGCTLQLIDYLDLLSNNALQEVQGSEAREYALVFLPQINEMRVARGQGVLTEATLFCSQMLDARVALPEQDLSGRQPGEAQAAAARYLPALHAALAQWLKDQDVETNLKRIGKIAEQIAQTATRQDIYHLWSLATAVMEGALTDGIKSGLEIKRVIGYCGQSLKQLADVGEEKTEIQPELIYRLMYYVGRASRGGARIQAACEAYQLDIRLPSRQMLETVRNRLRGHNTGLVQQLSGALKDDLKTVKDTIDLLVRAGDLAPDSLDDALRLLNQISDTLGMLGLSGLQNIVRNQLASISALDDDKQHDEQEWMDVAIALLRVEHSLDDALFRQMRNEDQVEASACDEKVSPTDLQTGQLAILREALVNMARIKTAIRDYIEDGERYRLSETVSMSLEVGAGLRMLDRNTAADWADQLAQFFSGPDVVRIRQDFATADLLADAVSGLEYYLEAIREGQADVDDAARTMPLILDKLQGLGEDVESKADSAEVVPFPDVQTGVLEDQASEEDDRPSEVTTEQAPTPEPAVRTLDEVDPEIKQIFIEEATEVLEGLSKDVPRWAGNIQDHALMADIRRAFHTLKGSGRMVQASLIGESAWAVEAMLNQCLDGSVATGPAVVKTVERATELMPAFLEQFSQGGDRASLTEQSEQLVEQARRAQRPAATDVPEPTELPAEQSGQVPLESHSELTDEQPAHDGAVKEAAISGKTSADDIDLLKVFRSDARRRLDVVRRAASAGQPIDNELLRAVHSLNTSADTVGVTRIAEVSNELETLLDTLHMSALDLRNEDSEILNSVADWLEIALNALDEGQPLPDASNIVDSIRRHRNALPEDILDAASNRGIALVFTDEASDLLDSMVGNLGLWLESPRDAHYPDSIQSALQSFKSSSRTAEADVISEVVTPLSAWMDRFVVSGVRLDETIHGLLHQVFDGLYDLLDDFRHGLRHGNSAALIRLIDDLEAHVQDLAEQLPASETVEDAEAVEVEQEKLQIAETDDDNEVDVAESDDLLLQPAPDEPQPDYDPELIDIFVSEAEELLEQIDHTLENWRQQPEDVDSGRNMLRILHTLKGSARMAQVMSIGDLSHDMESRVAEVELGKVKVDEDLLDRFQQDNDQLHQYLETLKHQGQDVHAAVSGISADQATAAAGEDVEEGDASVDGDAAVAAPVAEGVDEPENMQPAAIRYGWHPALFWQPDEDESERQNMAGENARVAVSKLDDLLNQAGEISIFRSRLDQINSTLHGQLSEVSQTVDRVRDQLRKLELETEAQITAGSESESSDRYVGEFDALEMDRYSRMNEQTRSLAEAATDLNSLHGLMEAIVRESDSLLLQQHRVNTELQEGLMSALMVPFDRHSQRLNRIVRQTAQELNREVELHISGARIDMDRNVLERMLSPIEHLLRNAVVHGIENTDERAAAGKPQGGQIHIRLRREGSQLAMDVQDDGRGLDYPAIARKAQDMGLLPQGVDLPPAELSTFIFEPGFSTAETLTQAAGRGVGMDVVNDEVRQLGGSIEVHSEKGAGTRFLIRLPLSMAMSQVLLVRISGELYAVPLTVIEGIARIPAAELTDHLAADGGSLNYGPDQYEVMSMHGLLGLEDNAPDEDQRSVSALLIAMGERHVALVVDHVLSTREIVSKPMGPQIASIIGVTGGTILPDGRVILILDPLAMLQAQSRRALLHSEEVSALKASEDARSSVMVVDDSITMRRVAERTLQKNGYRVITAKDGMDALALLQNEAPDVMLLDIEMPRIDGFELATYVRNSDQLRHVPIIMITSRSGDKHRSRAKAIGVNQYLIKPYQEQELLDAIGHLIEHDSDATLEQADD